MSSEDKMDHFVIKRIKLEEKLKILTSIDPNKRNSVVVGFKDKCMKFFTKQLDDKIVRDYINLNNTGKSF